MPAHTQQGFAAAVIDRNEPVPEGIGSWNTDPPRQRFSVHRTNVASALIGAIAIRYPVVRRLVGEEFFRAMTRDYVLSHLPRSPVLIHYGVDYPDFIASFPPAASLPYLGDVARLESAHWESYHAADGMVADATCFAGMAAGRLAATRIDFLPSVRIVASPYPIVSIWETNIRDREVRSLELNGGEDALVSRPHLDVEIRRLPAGAVTFFRNLMAGSTMAEATSAAVEREPRFDLARNLKGLIEAGVIASLRLP
jgi:hypothetical protein